MVKFIGPHNCIASFNLNKLMLDLISRVFHNSVFLIKRGPTESKYKRVPIKSVFVPTVWMAAPPSN